MNSVKICYIYTLFPCFSGQPLCQGTFLPGVLSPGISETILRLEGLAQVVEHGLRAMNIGCSPGNLEVLLCPSSGIRHTNRVIVIRT